MSDCASFLRQTTLGVVLGISCALARPTALALELPPAKSDQPLLRIHGSSAVVSILAPELAQGFLEKEGFIDIQRRNGDKPQERFIIATAPDGTGSIKIELSAQGTGYGLKDLATGATDIAVADQPKAAFATDNPKSGEQVDEHVIALGAVSIIVNKVNTLHSLSSDQVAGLLSGEIKNWSQVDGPNWPVHVYVRDSESGSTRLIDQNILQNRRKTLSAAAKLLATDNEQSRAISGDPSGVAYVGNVFKRDNKALAIADGSYSAIAPTANNIATEDYPLARRIYFYTQATGNNPWIQAFVKFSQSPQGQALIPATGFVALEPKLIKVKPNHKMPQPYRELVDNAQRLSINFRFPSGSSHLDDKSRHDIGRVVDYVRGHGIEHFALAAFGSGGEERAQAMAGLRALAIRRALYKGGVVTTDIRNFGDRLPVAPDGTERGKYRNQRVEIWIFPNSGEVAKSL